MFWKFNQISRSICEVFIDIRWVQNQIVPKWEKRPWKMTYEHSIFSCVDIGSSKCYISRIPKRWSIDVCIVDGVVRQRPYLLILINHCISCWCFKCLFLVPLDMDAITKFHIYIINQSISTAKCAYFPFFLLLLRSFFHVIRVCVKKETGLFHQNRPIKRAKNNSKQFIFLHCVQLAALLLKHGNSSSEVSKECLLLQISQHRN